MDSLITRRRVIPVSYTHLCQRSVGIRIGQCENNRCRWIAFRSENQRPDVYKRQLQGDELRYTDRRNAGDLLEFKELVQRHAGDLVRGQPGFICCGKDPVGAAKGNMEFLGDLRHFRCA